MIFIKGPVNNTWLKEIQDGKIIAKMIIANICIPFEHKISNQIGFDNIIYTCNTVNF